MKTLHNLFLSGLSDIYDAERRIAKALPAMAKAATCDNLRAAFLEHLEETGRHVTMVEQVFECFGKKARGKTCKATVGLLEEAAEVAEEFQGSPAINAALISAAQKVEHYEMAAYGCLHEWAVVLENDEAASLLEEILAEEKVANETLTELAVSSCNDEAVGGDGSQESQDQEDDKPANPAKLVAG